MRARLYREIFVFASFLRVFRVASTGVVRNGVRCARLAIGTRNPVAGRPAAGRGRELAGGYAPAQRPRHEGALANAWNYVSGALARFASDGAAKNNYGEAS